VVTEKIKKLGGRKINSKAIEKFENLQRMKNLLQLRVLHSDAAGDWDQWRSQEFCSGEPSHLT